jgi:hypothetical protein
MDKTQVCEIYNALGNPVTEESLKNAIEAGLIPKEELVHGQEYWGHCRNARVAVWDANSDVFIYIRYKFGSVFCESIVHPADDKGFDIFVPVAVHTPEERIIDTEFYKQYYDRCVNAVRRNKGLNAYCEELDIERDFGSFKVVSESLFGGDHKKLSEALDNVVLEPSEIPVPLWKHIK